MTKLLVNVAGTMGARYLLVSINIVGAGDGFTSKMSELDAQLRDMAQGALRSKTLADLEKPGAVNLIRSELISGFNSILGGSWVKEIYVTEFAIQ
jgi:flagellar FliL protein